MKKSRAAQPQRSSEQRLFDVAFFLRGVPLDRRVHNETMVIATIAGSGEKIIKSLSEAFPEFRHFCNEKPNLSLSVFCYRGKHPDRSEAIKTAHTRLEGIRDIYALVLDHNIEPAKLILVRQDHSPDAEILTFLTGGYALSGTDMTTLAGQWSARNHLVLENLLGHVDYIAEHPNIKPSLLRTDLLNALRLYRQGSESNFHGLEFLAKFAALECLVCGPETQRKKALLLERLTLLFEDSIPTIKSLVRKLWLLRCSGSHQAAVATERTDSELMPACVANLHLDRLFAGVSYFALEFVSQCDTNSDLWAKCTSYSLPELVALDRPKGMVRMAVETMVADYHKRVVGAGEIFDHLHRSLPTGRHKKRTAPKGKSENPVLNIDEHEENPNKRNSK